MIISHRYKFIFIKTRKTAGSSVQKVLRNYLGPTDIADGDWLDKLEPLNVTYQRNKMDGHQTAKWISKAFPLEWQNYYKFTIERNPWHKAKSAFKFYQQIKLPNLPNNFDDFLSWRKRKWIPKDWNWYTMNNSICVDKIIQYDNLHSEFKQLMKDLGVSYKDELVKTRMKSYASNFDAQDYSDSNNLIDTIFKDEINYFKYTKPMEH